MNTYKLTYKNPVVGLYYGMEVTLTLTCSHRSLVMFVSCLRSDPRVKDIYVVQELKREIVALETYTVRVNTDENTLGPQ